MNYVKYNASAIGISCAAYHSIFCKAAFFNVFDWPRTIIFINTHTFCYWSSS